MAQEARRQVLLEVEAQYLLVEPEVEVVSEAQCLLVEQEVAMVLEAQCEREVAEGQHWQVVEEASVLNDWLA